MKTNAAVVMKVGGPEVLEYREVELREPGPGEALIAQEAIGVNFIDINQRSGVYKIGELPAILGSEGAGVVEKLGPGVTDLKVGDRVAYGLSPPGAYAQKRVIAADRLVPVPTEIPLRVAASIMLKGLTAEFLLRRTCSVRRGDTIVIHAAAGGVGTIMTQWARDLGATVIGIVGHENKVPIAYKNGCHTVLLTTDKWVARVRELTGGKGAPVVYDSVGKDTFDGSLDCLAIRGVLVLFGQASGPVPPVDPSRLAKGSFYLTRPTLFQYDAERSDLLAGAAALFETVKSGALRIDRPTIFPLAEAWKAHEAIQSRKTTGSIVLIP